jgi:hypothetical protein
MAVPAAAPIAVVCFGRVHALMDMQTLAEVRRVRANRGADFIMVLIVSD